MKSRIPPVKRLIVLFTVVVPALAWCLVKPVRVMAPGLAGVSCTADRVCVDDVSRLEQASALVEEARGFLKARLGTAPYRPRVVFCATQACADSFGLGERSAMNLAGLGTVMGPRAWTAYYLRHELIHQLQSEQLGVVRMLLRPAWWTEGMAYALSEDPRPVLAEPWQGHRTRFQAWHARTGDAGLWTAPL
jgi:hypothetical protein